MKKSISIIVTLLISLIIMSFSPSLVFQDENKSIVATYEGITDDVQFMFIDGKENVLLFDDVLDDLEYDLYDDFNIGKKFTITWEEDLEEDVDLEEPENGKPIIFKTIIRLELKKEK